MTQGLHHQMSHVIMNFEYGRQVAGNWAHSQATGT